MKKFKKLFALLLSVVMALGMSTVAFADGGSITIENPTAGETYSVYKVFDLTIDSNTNPSAYSYALNSNWKGLKTYDADGNGTMDYTTYFTLDSNDTVTWVKKDDYYNLDGGEEFAKFLKKYLDSGVTVTPSARQGASTSTLEFTDLEYGYYFVTSSLGAVCSLDSTNPNATVKDKNPEDSVEKKVEEDSVAGGTYAVNDADIGDEVNFTTTVTIGRGTASLVIHDQMGEGFTAVDGDDYDTVIDVVVKNGNTELTAVTDYTISNSSTSDETSGTGLTNCSFEITLTDSYLNGLNWDGTGSTETLTITYSATLNSSATIGGKGNENETVIEYQSGDTNASTAKRYSAASTTKTYTWELPILKTKSDKTTALSNAQFRLYVTEESTNYYAIITNGKMTGWSKNKDSNCSEDNSDSNYASTLTSDSDGKINVQGLDSGTYYLEEIKAPDGYNKLTDPVTITITAKNSDTASTEGDQYAGNGLTTEIKYKLTDNGEETALTDGGSVTIANSTGSELPSTGSIGTTIFYVIGGILVVGAVVLLITKKRMENYDK